jgi:hypothetical protein
MGFSDRALCQEQLRLWASAAARFDGPPLSKWNVSDNRFLRTQARTVPNELRASLLLAPNFWE